MKDLNQNDLAKLQNTISEDQLILSEQVGALKAFEFTQKLLTVSTIKMLSEIKETKRYKGLQLIGQDGKLLTVSSWDDFCQSLGHSRQKIDLDIQNLSAFGEDFLETSQRMGVGYRDLRKLRKLPEAEREVIINGESVQAEDKDSLIDLIEEMSAKNLKTKQAMQKQIDDLSADAKAKDTVLSTKNKKIDELDAQLSLRKQPDQKHELEKQLEAHISSELAQSVTSILTAISQFNASILTLREQAESDVPHLSAKIDSDVSYAYGRIAELAATDGIEIDLAQMVTPDWMIDTPSIDIPAAAPQPISDPAQEAATFQAWREEQGYISDDDFELRGQTPDQLNN